MRSGPSPWTNNGSKQLNAQTSEARPRRSVRREGSAVAKFRNCQSGASERRGLNDPHGSRNRAEARRLESPFLSLSKGMLQLSPPSVRSGASFEPASQRLTPNSRQLARRAGRPALLLPARGEKVGMRGWARSCGQSPRPSPLPSPRERGEGTRREQETGSAGPKLGKPSSLGPKSGDWTLAPSGLALAGGKLRARWLRATKVARKRTQAAEMIDSRKLVRERSRRRSDGGAQVEIAQIGRADPPARGRLRRTIDQAHSL